MEKSGSRGIVEERPVDTVTKSLEELINELPPDMHIEVRDFIEFLLTKREQRSESALRQDWAGALREHRQEYSSLDLERRAMDWRGD